METASRKKVSQLGLFDEMDRLRVETKKRDEALDRLTVSRMYLVNLACSIAEEIYESKGRVTSTEVFRLLKAQVGAEVFEEVDPRFLGVVFRKGWCRVGFETTGSHRRPVSIWIKKAV